MLKVVFLTVYLSVLGVTKFSTLEYLCQVRLRARVAQYDTCLHLVPDQNSAYNT